MLDFPEENQVRLAQWFAHKHAKPGEDCRELANVAWMAIRNAMDYFDESRGYQFSSYAVAAMRRQLWEYRQQMRRQCRVGRNGVKGTKPIILFSEIERGNRWSEYGFASNSASSLRFMLAVWDDEPDLDPDVEDADQMSLLSGLRPRDQKIVAMHAGLDGYRCHTLEEIGAKFGVSRQRIYQILEKAFLAIKETHWRSLGFVEPSEGKRKYRFSRTCRCGCGKPAPNRKQYRPDCPRVPMKRGERK